MNSQNNFLDELLLEAEQKEEQQTIAYYDLILLDIQKLQSAIDKTLAETDREVEIIKQWASSRCSKFQEKINFYRNKLEAYTRELKVKTLDLPPNGRC